jgi:SAM-dependent methyltransferase
MDVVTERPEAVERLTVGVGQPAHTDILARCLSGALSPAVTIMQLLIETEDAAEVRTMVDEVTRRAAFVSRATDSLIRDRVDELTQILVENEPGCDLIAGMLRSNMDSPDPAPSVDEGIAFCERLFDWSVQQSEEASVALYSLGNPQLLERATREVVAQLEHWNVITPKSSVLDIGCGIGRISAELGPKVRDVHGVDVSSKMIDAALRRCGSSGNVRFLKTGGRDLHEFESSSFDAAIAVDTFPYIHQSGAQLVETYFDEVRRVLKPNGNFVIFNYSYRGAEATDIGEVVRLAEENGFDVMVRGERPLAMWDALVFHLRRQD